MSWETIENNIRYIYLDKISWMSKMAQIHTVNFYCMLTTLNVMLVYVAKSYQIGPCLTEHNNFCAYTHIQNLVVFTIIMWIVLLFLLFLISYTPLPENAQYVFAELAYFIVQCRQIFQTEAAYVFEFRCSKSRLVLTHFLNIK